MEIQKEINEKSSPKMVVSDYEKYKLILNGDTEAVINNPPFIYFTDTRDPTSVEPAINPVINWSIWWINLSSMDIFDCVSPVSGNYTWTKRINSLNITPLLNSTVPSIVNSVLQSSLPSLLTSILPTLLPTLGVFPTVARQRQYITLSPGVSRQPSLTRDVEVCVNIKLSSVVSLNASATLETSPDGQTWNDDFVDSKNITLASNFTDPVGSITVPAGSYYRVILGGSGASIGTVSELLV